MLTSFARWIRHCQQERALLDCFHIMGDGAVQYQYLALGQIKELAIRMHPNVAKKTHVLFIVAEDGKLIPPQRRRWFLV
jgi:hypothetical protein